MNPVNEKSVTAGKTLYFDCYSGISGDMTLGALLDLGLKLEDLQEMLKGLKIGGYRLEAEKVNRGGIAGTRAMVHLDEKTPVGRHLSSILDLINESDLPGPVKIKSSAIFQHLAEAEASVHGIAVEKVHFHEVGAVDAIVDIVGVSGALFLLGIEHIACSPLPAGRGAVQTAHGLLPLPAPATLELLARRKAPIWGCDQAFELVTPTGAAIVTALADSFGPIPVFNLESIGYGAGSHDPGYPNYLRLLLGSSPAPSYTFEEEVAVLESNIDDLNPEIFGYLMEKAFEAGALDIFYTPIQMKKNRPAVQLTILAPPENLKVLQDLVFSETSTLGFRLTSARKIMRLRETKTVETKWGAIRIKCTPLPGDEMTGHFAPEYDDCCKIARLSGLPLKEVYRLAEKLFLERS